VDLLNQARGFIARKASKLAMAAIPLAALAIAVPAKATTVTLDGNGTDNCYASQSGICTLATNSTGGNTFMNQLVLTGATTSSSGGETNYANLSNSGSGTAMGTLPVGIVPVSWDFTISDNLGPVGWSVQFFLDFSGGYYQFFTSGTTSGGEVTGSGSISIFAVQAITGYGIGVFASGGSAFNLAAPLTINSQTSAPEPGSLLLMGAGGAALLVLRRKKRV